ncbi:MAG: hypothetical protein Q7R95_00775, partial [bacterium]|nr:hypothetical protein [bacterium]
MANENILAANTELGFKYEIQRDLIREFQIAFRQKSFAQTEISTCGDTGFASFGGSCVTYHGLFPTLEMLNMASSARHNPELFLQSLANHFPGNSPVVWIPAAATPRLYDMIRFVKPDALVFNTDICATPVCTIPFSNPKDIERGVYAGYVLDVLKSPFAELFDVIATDAFLTRFSKEDRVKVLQIFYKALKPGGVLLTTVRNPKVGESSPLQLTEIENKDSHNYSEKVLIAYRKLVRRAGNP